MNVIRFSLAIWWFCYLGSSVCAEVTIKGQIHLSEGWRRTIYASSIHSLAELYVCSDHLIVASAPVDSFGYFELKLAPSNQERIVRLHVSKKGAPAAMLIIGGDEENHGFYGIENGKSYVIASRKFSKKIFEHFDLRDKLNSNLRKVDLMIQNWQAIDQNMLLTPHRDEARNSILADLTKFSDTCSQWLPSLYALFRSDMGFNGDVLRSQMAKLARNAPRHPYLQPYAAPYRRSIWALPMIISFALGLGYLGWQKISNQRLANKVALLSPQELKVAKLLRAGKTNKEIAYLLHVEISTVKSHIYRIFNKLEISSRQDIRRFTINA